MVVFIEGGDPCLFGQGDLCLKCVRPGDKVFLLLVVWCLYTSLWNAEYGCNRPKSTFKCGGISSLVTNTHPRKLPASMWEVSRGCLQWVNVTSAVGK
jgi:hypothetical protein